MMDDPVHETTLRVDGSHPSLAGHFPGRPLVPGVVLLDCVLAAAERWLGRPVSFRQLAQAKFTAPLLPERSAQVLLRLTARELRFSVTHAGTTIAQGVFKDPALPLQ